PRYQHFARTGERQDARRDMDCDALHVVLDNLDLAGMKTAADLKVEWTDGLDDGAGTTHGTGRPIESGEKAVTQRLHFVAAEAREFPTHSPMMQVEPV